MTTPPGNPTSTPTRLYASADEALKKVGSEFEYWTGRLTDASTQMCYALIGANWAIFGSVHGILSNGWAKCSLILVLVTLATGVAGAWYLSEALRRRVAYAEENLDRWEREYEHATQKGVSWPFTRAIEGCGLLLRWIKSTFTLLSGLFLIIGALVSRP